MIDINKIKLIAFDADDTLWDCQSYYDEAEDTYTKILERYGIGAKEVAESLFETETKNMPLLGYGCKAFILSLIENAVKMTHREIEGKDIQSILNLSHHLLTSLGQPLVGIEDTLKKLKRGSDVPRGGFCSKDLCFGQLMGGVLSSLILSRLVLYGFSLAFLFLQADTQSLCS